MGVPLGATYARAIPWAAIVWPPHFVKVVLVQLADEAGEVAVFEVFREHTSREFLALSRDVIRYGVTKITLGKASSRYPRDLVVSASGSVRSRGKQGTYL